MHGAVGTLFQETRAAVQAGGVVRILVIVSEAGVERSNDNNNNHFKIKQEITM